MRSRDGTHPTHPRGGRMTSVVTSRYLFLTIDRHDSPMKGACIARARSALAHVLYPASLPGRAFVGAFHRRSD